MGNRRITEKQEPEKSRRGKIQKGVEYFFTFVTAEE
jgi:hypothetical protein